MDQGTVEQPPPHARRAAFIRRHTRVLPVPLVPEVRLHTADEATALWEKTEADLGRLDLPPPFWAFPWAGGQGLARFILDRPEAVAGRSVLDFAAGSGLCAIAAALAGARRVAGADIDPYAATAIGLNAALNNVDVMALHEDVVGERVEWDVILAGDISYQKDVAARVHGWLADMAGRGTRVLIGDPGRAYLPAGLRELARYEVPTVAALEDADSKSVGVFTLSA